MYYLEILFEGDSTMSDCVAQKTQFETYYERDSKLDAWKDRFMIAFERSNVIFESKSLCEINNKQNLLNKYKREGKEFEYRYQIKNDKNKVMLTAYYITEPEQNTDTEDDAPSQQ